MRSRTGSGRTWPGWPGWPPGWRPTPTATTWCRRRWPAPGSNAGSTTRRGTPSAWLLAIVADQAGKARRRLRALRPAGELTDRPGPAAPTEQYLDIERAVRGLPERQRLAVNCFYFAGLSVAETAAVMRCAEGTVKSTLADARARLRPLLEVAG